MQLSWPTLKELPSVQAALAWLLAVPANGDVIAAARLKGLVLSKDDEPQWKVNGDIATDLTKDALDRLPDDPEQYGKILHGIGEIAARSHMPTIRTLFVNDLKARQEKMPLQEILDAAINCDTAIPHQIGVAELALAQWLTRATLEWNTFNAAVSRLEHPDRIFGRFGLGFAAPIILSTDTNAIDRWIESHPDHPALAVIGSAALTMVFPFDTQADVAPLLKSKNVAVKCLGAASIVCPVGLGPPVSFRDCHKALIAAGFAAADATWMTGIRIKNAIHQRYWLEHQQVQNSARLRYVEQNPDEATGGIHNAEAETRILRERIKREEETYSILLPELEAMLGDMAADWPATGLTDEQMAALEHIFVDTPEIRYRLATKLAHQSNRNWLLKRNIKRLEEFIGLQPKPADVPKRYSAPNETQFAKIVNWTALSLVLLYDTDQRGIGRRTSDLVFGIAQFTKTLAAQPFISGRDPETWDSIVTRSAYAGRFAFTVAKSVLAERRDEVAGLNELALSHAFMLLSASNPPANGIKTFHELAAQAVEHMAFCSDPEKFRRDWALAENLPDFARALALWASPALVDQHKQLTSDVFRRVCALPLSRHSYSVQLSRMLTLLDIAVASAAGAERLDLLTWIAELWRSAYPDWLEICKPYEGTADTLIAAVHVEGPERAQIVADKAFAESYCRRLIEACRARSTTEGTAVQCSQA
jgi:hypothetical protein